MPALSARPKVIPSAAQTQPIRHASVSQSLCGRKHVLRCLSNVIRCKPYKQHANTQTLKMLTKLKSLYQMQTLLLCIRFCGLTLKGSYSYHLRMQSSRLWLKTQEQRTHCCDKSRHCLCIPRHQARRCKSSSAEIFYPKMLLTQHIDSMQNMQNLACL